MLGILLVLTGSSYLTFVRTRPGIRKHWQMLFAKMKKDLKDQAIIRAMAISQAVPLNNGGNCGFWYVQPSLMSCPLCFAYLFLLWMKRKPLCIVTESFNKINFCTHFYSENGLH